MPSAEQTQKWNKEKLVDALRRSTDKPRMEYCKDQDGTVIYIRAVQGHSHGSKIKHLFPLKEMPLNMKEHVFHTGSSSNSTSMLENGLWAGGY